MYRAIAEAGVLSQVGLVMRFSPVYTVARAMIREPDAGRTLAATMRDDQDFPIRGAHNSLWRNDPAMTAGGTMVEHSVHDIDLFTWMFGEPRRVYCRTRNLAGAAGIEDVAITALEFDDGLTAQVTSVWHRMIARASNRRFESFSENLVVASEHDGLGPIVVQRGDDAHESVIPAAEVLALFKTIILDERPYLRAIDDCLEIAYAIEDAIFIAAIRGECDPYPAFADGVAVQRVVERAYESARRGVPVSIESKVIL
jgi:predicted dehydrogenase